MYSARINTFKTTFKINAISAFLLLNILILLSSCQGQNISKKENNIPLVEKEIVAVGETVSVTEDGVMNIFQDSQNNYWLGGGKKGVYKYNGKNLIRYSTKDGLCSNSILRVQEDKSGNIYFESSEGVSKYDGQKFTTLEIFNNDSSKNEWKLEPDDLWFTMGWDKSGPFRYDGKFLYYLEFPKSPQEDEFYRQSPNMSYSPYGIYSSYKDSKGNVWFGTASLGFCRYDGKSVRWHYEDQLQTTANGGDFGTRSIFEDKDGYFWINNTRYRYAMLPNTESGTNQLAYKKEKGIGYLNEDNQVPFTFFMSIAQDDDGDLWMLTYDDGVWRNNGKELIHYPIKDGDKEILLFSIYKDNQGVLWLGTHNGGAYKFNGEKFEPFIP